MPARRPSGIQTWARHARPPLHFQHPARTSFRMESDLVDCLGIAAVGFKKAFDTVEHSSLWTALRRQGVPPEYVHLLQRLYHDQKASVRTDSTSKPSKLRRGTKQGDLLSSLLFNALLQHVPESLIPDWQRRRRGLQLAHTDESVLTNLRFADDILLVSQTLPNLKTLLGDLVTAASPHGLEVHPTKTKIMTY